MRWTLPNAPFVPAQAGTQSYLSKRWSKQPLGSRLRGNERVESACARYALRCAAALALGLLSAIAPAQAQSVEQFYRGNQLVLLVGHDAGGGYDLYSRVLSHHIGKHIPGNPTVVVKTMPGAGGLKMITHLYSTAPQDGSTFGISDRGYVLEPLLGNKAANFDVSKMSPVGSVGRQTPTCTLWHGARAKSLRDTFTQETIIGGTGPSATTIYPAILNATLKTKFKIVAGYRGSPEIMVALERGEAEGVCLSWDTLKTIKPDWLADGKLKVIVQMAEKRIPELKDVPTANEHASNEADRKMLSLYFGPNEMGRPYIGPPNVPRDRLAAVRRAFDATMKDKAYVAEAKGFKMDIDPMTGEEMADLIKSFYESPPDLVERLKVALSQYRAHK
jgi:tripartite-type tricarboxylate transporter receptor subunit TctC